MPNIGSHEVKIGFPVLLTLVLLTIIPSSPGYIDCRISCRRCHENTEHPAVLEVYCAMCEECKQRRRERMQGRTTKGKENPTSKLSAKPTLKPLEKLTKSKQLVRMRDGAEANVNNEAMIIRPQDNVQFRQGEQDYPGQSQSPLEHQQPFVLQQQLLNPPQRPPEQQPLRPSYKPQKPLRGLVYPEGCPTPPICSDSEDEVEVPYVPRPPTPTTTTTTTTTTQQPCPPVPKCVKKKKKSPCMNPCMGPPFMCPCPMYPSSLKPGDVPSFFPSMPPDYHPSNLPLTLFPFMPHMQPQNPYLPSMYPPPILVPMHPQWPGWFPHLISPQTKSPTTPTTSEAEVQDLQNKTSTKSEEFFYLHVGLPV